MDVSEEMLQSLSQWFLHTLSPSHERLAAESSLSAAANTPGFSLAVLRLISEPAVDEQIRVAAAIYFKNGLRSRWSPLASSSDPPIPVPEKDQIKSIIVAVMLAASPRIKSHIGESLSVISAHDFPRRWPSLLPELVASIRSSSDYTSINGLLSVASSIFSRFRTSFGTDDVRLDLKYSLDAFASPLLEIFLKTSSLMASNVTAAPENFRLLLESQRLCCDIFQSLNFVELPEFFEDHMREWMGEFLIFLTTTYPSPVEADGTVDSLRAAVCENLQLYMEKYEEEFKDYLKDFASAVWSLLLVSATSLSRDELTITALKFLTAVSTSVHHALFESPEILQQICQSLVFPNVRISDEDEDRFKMDYMEYIGRDIEGSDAETKRRIACELLKGLASHYKEQVNGLVSLQIQNMLASYAANPRENWKEKDCAIYLVISLIGKSNGSHLVDIEVFFTSFIVPELRGVDVKDSPILKSAALKFFTVFREKISKHAAMACLPDVIGFLASSSYVVHSYAANCIEKILLVKDKMPMSITGSNVVVSRARYTSNDINPLLPLLIPNLFKALEFPESHKNAYVMKCIMRVLMIANVPRDVTEACIARLTLVLSVVCKDPKTIEALPAFSYYLFEAIAALIAGACNKEQSIISVFETKLFPELQNILANDISEFWPYTFQLFAQLVDMSRPPLSVSYSHLFEVLLLPDTWRKTANVPALVRLLQAFLQKIPNEINHNKRLENVLGIFSHLLSSSSKEELGFFVLNTVVENLDYTALESYVPTIWTTLFTQLQSRRTVKFVNSVLIFMALFLVKNGPGRLVDSINAIKPNLFGEILRQFWIPNLRLITGSLEVKLASVASTRLICETLLDPSVSELWGKVLDSNIVLIAQPEGARVQLENGVTDFQDDISYSESFVRLHNAGKKEDDPLKEIMDPKNYIVTSLAKLSASSPGRFPSVIAQYVDPANQAALLQMCGVYGLAIV